MSIIDAILYGLVQGLTEFLPVSSSAHLRILGEFLPGAKDPGAAFTAIIQLGTEAAVLVYFWKDIVRIAIAWFRSLGSLGTRHGKHSRVDTDARMGWAVIIGTIPIGVLGLLFQDQIETTFRSLWIVSVTLIGFGVILGLADSLSKRVKTERSLTLGDALIMGLAQALALIPGVSRSGGTTTAGRLLKYDRTSSALFSFYLALPAVVASGLYQLYKSFAGTTHDVPDLLPTSIATVVAFLVGWLVIARLMKYLKSGSFLPFVIYRVALGGALIVLLSTGVIAA